MALEVEKYIRCDEAFRPCHTRKIQAQLMADRAGRSIRAYDPLRAHFFQPIGRHHLQCRAVHVLRQADQSCIEAKSCVRILGEAAQCNLSEPMLTQVQVVGKRRAPVEHLQTKVNALPRLVHQVGVVLLGEAGPLNLFPHAEHFQIVENAPVVDGGAGRIDDFGFRFNHSYADTCARETERAYKTGRPATDDDHLIH
jgi:hypothetical protein